MRRRCRIRCHAPRGVRGRLLSFVSPCVLPLIPGYLSFISGVSLDEMRGRHRGRVGVAPARCSSRRSPSSSASRSCSSRSARRPAAIGSSCWRSGRCSARSRASSSSSSACTRWGLLASRLLDSEKRVQAQRKPAGRSARCSSASRSRSAGRRASARSSPASWRSPASKEHRRRGRAAAGGLLAGPRHPVPAHVAGDQPVLRGIEADPQALSRDRVGLGRAARRHRRADLHEPVHDHRPLPAAVPARLLSARSPSSPSAPARTVANHAFTTSSRDDSACFAAARDSGVRSSASTACGSAPRASSASTTGSSRFRGDVQRRVPRRRPRR